MNYSLTNTNQPARKIPLTQAIKGFWPFLQGQKANLLIALVAILVNAVLNLIGPFLIGRAVDLYVTAHDYPGILRTSGWLVLVYAGSFVGNYIQTKSMGTVGQELLFNLRNAIFDKLQSLPIAFFNQNKVGDLISRINNDTDKLNLFFSQSLMQFVGNFFSLAGAGIFMVVINSRLGTVALLPAVGILIFNQVLAAWVKKQNALSLKATGDMSAEIQESLNNFKVIVAFNRRDYFSQKFQEVNQNSFTTSVSAGIANGVFNPVYGWASNLAQLLVLVYGIYLISTGQFTIGLLISFFTYLSRFYDPIRQLANVFATFQQAIASWDRISEILKLTSTMKIEPVAKQNKSMAALLEFKRVTFGYDEGQDVLHDISFKLFRGKTYALVGPTGGGKTTTASLIARLYDPTKGKVLLDGRDIRTYTEAERVQKIGFILQEPFLFSGTVKDNLVYGNAEYQQLSDEQLTQVLKDFHLHDLLVRFPEGLATSVVNGGENISLGQRQLIAFMRAALRRPELLILDEATANVDTVTEQLLEDILDKLPTETTKVVIAHRLNTIENADEIFFVNAGKIVKAGSFKHAVDLLLHDKKIS